MTTSRTEIQGWLARAQRGGARYLLVGRDNFSYENYPIFVLPDDDVWDIVDHLGDNGTGGLGDSLEEAYDLHLDIEAQLAEYRASHLPPRTSEPTGRDTDRAKREDARWRRLFAAGFYG